MEDALAILLKEVGFLKKVRALFHHVKMFIRANNNGGMLLQNNNDYSCINLIFSYSSVCHHHFPNTNPATQSTLTLLCCFFFKPCHKERMLDQLPLFSCL